MIKTFAKFLIVCILVTPLGVLAQFNISQSFTPDYAGELTMELVPTYPKPGERVTLNLKMYTENLSSSQISWFVDGILKLSGVGETTYSFTAPKSGSPATVEVRVTTFQGISFNKKIIINPASIDMIWEALSYTPPFYKGKALFPPQGEVKVLAMPNFYSNGEFINPGRLLYTWTVNGNVLENQSGYGKNIAFVTGSILGRPIEVELLATDPATGMTANNFMTINTTEPEIIFYENHPLYGLIFEKTLDKAGLGGNELSVVAYPYNLSANEVDDVIYSWRVNNNLTPEIYGREATFTKPQGVSGSSVVSLSLQNQSRILQSAKKSFSITFSNNENSSF